MAMIFLLNQELWERVLGHLPLRSRAMLCRVCKPLGEVVRVYGLDYGVATLCTVLAEHGCTEALKRMYGANPGGIPCDLGRLDQARRFIAVHKDAKEQLSSVNGWLQLASQQPDGGWLCEGAKGTRMDGGEGGPMVQVFGKQQGYSPLLSYVRVSDSAESVAFSPDGNTMAFSVGSYVELRNAHTMDLKGTLTGHSDYVRCVAWSPDGKFVASASGDKT